MARKQDEPLVIRRRYLDDRKAQIETLRYILSLPIRVPLAPVEVEPKPEPVTNETDDLAA
jgi:hypothetical protein